MPLIILYSFINVCQWVLRNYFGYISCGGFCLAGYAVVALDKAVLVFCDE